MIAAPTTGLLRLKLGLELGKALPWVGAVAVGVG